MKVKVFLIVLLMTINLDKGSSKNTIDCLVYKSTGSNFNHFNYLTFENRARIGFIVNSNSDWNLQLEIRQNSGSNYCIITIKITGNVKELTSKCSSRFGLSGNGVDGYIPGITVDYLRSAAWNYFDLIQVRDDNGNDNVYVVSSDATNNKLMVLKDAKLQGELRVRWLPGDFDMNYNFNCYSGCLLESQNSFIHSNDPSDMMLYLWRGSEQSKLKFKYGSKLLRLPQTDPTISNSDRWIKVKKNESHSAFYWARLNSDYWTSVSWPNEATSHFRQFGYEVLISADSLMTKCHPYHLRCPDINSDICTQDTGSDYGYIMNLLLALSYILLVFVIIVSIIAVKRIKNKSQHCRHVSSIKDKVLYRCNENTYKKSPKVHGNKRQSIEFDDFTSDHIYEDPLEFFTDTIRSDGSPNVDTLRSNRSHNVDTLRSNRSHNVDTIRSNRSHNVDTKMSNGSPDVQEGMYQNIPGV